MDFEYFLVQILCFVNDQHEAPPGAHLLGEQAIQGVVHGGQIHAGDVHARIQSSRWRMNSRASQSVRKTKAVRALSRRIRKETW